MGFCNVTAQVNVLLHAGVEFDKPMGDQDLLPIQMTKRAETRELLIRAKERADPNVRSCCALVCVLESTLMIYNRLPCPENSLLRRQSQRTIRQRRRCTPMSYSLRIESGEPIVITASASLVGASMLAFTVVRTELLASKVRVCSQNVECTDSSASLLQCIGHTSSSTSSSS
eukprot:COSAG02_NODE_16115_length_1111_cov_12.914876_2_plen_172_part_00